MSSLPVPLSPSIRTDAFEAAILDAYDDPDSSDFETRRSLEQARESSAHGIVRELESHGDDEAHSPKYTAIERESLLQKRERSGTFLFTRAKAYGRSSSPEERLRRWQCIERILREHHRACVVTGLQIDLGLVRVEVRNRGLFRFPLTRGIELRSHDPRAKHRDKVTDEPRRHVIETARDVRP